MLPYLPSGGGGTSSSLGLDFAPDSSRSGGAAAGIRAVGDGAGNAHLTLSTTTGGAATSLVERVRILSNGNVGIGTTIPTSKLVIDGNTSIGYPATTAPSNGLIVNGSVGIGTTNTLSKVHTYVTGANNYMLITGDTSREQGIQISDGTASIYLYKQINTTNFSIYNEGDRITIRNNGNVGIGTAIPQSKLHITGDTISTNFYTTSGSASVSTSDVTLFSFSGAGLLIAYGSNFMHVVVIGGMNGLTGYSKNTIYQGDFSRTLTITMSGLSVLARLNSGPTTLYWKYIQFASW